jgi:hypothetical protein
MAVDKKFFVDINLQGNALNNATIGSNSDMTKGGSFQYVAGTGRLEYFDDVTGLVKEVANLTDIATVTGGLIFQGGYDPTTGVPNITDGLAKKGYFWVAESAGEFLGQAVQAGDSIIALVNDAVADASQWLILQGNIVIATDKVEGVVKLATQAEVDAGVDGSAVVLTPATFANSTQLSSINDKLAAQAGDIKANSADITKQGEEIKSQGEAIKTNTEGIADNKKAISENSASIQKNSEAIVTNTESIAENTKSIEANTSDIAKNSEAITKNSEGIVTNSNDIRDNTLAIEKNTSSISENTKAIETNTTDIKTNTADISKNTADITTNTEAIAGNTKSISEQEKEIAVVKGRVDSLESEKLNASGGTMSGTLDMGGNLISNVAEPTSEQDAATKKYVDTQLGNAVFTGDFVSTDWADQGTHFTLTVYHNLGSSTPKVSAYVNGELVEFGVVVSDSSTVVLVSKIAAPAFISVGVSK